MDIEGISLFRSQLLLPCFMSRTIYTAVELATESPAPKKKTLCLKKREGISGMSYITFSENIAISLNSSLSGWIMTITVTITKRKRRRRKKDFLTRLNFEQSFPVSDDFFFWAVSSQLERAARCRHSWCTFCCGCSSV